MKLSKLNSNKNLEEKSIIFHLNCIYIRVVCTYHFVDTNNLHTRVSLTCITFSTNLFYLTLFHFNLNLILAHLTNILFILILNVYFYFDNFSFLLLRTDAVLHQTARHVSFFFFLFFRLRRIVNFHLFCCCC